MGRSISHVQIPVKNLEKAIDWYVNNLDCEFLANFDDFAIVRFKSDDVNIFMWKTSDETHATFNVNGQAFPTIGFQVDEMDSLYNILLKSGTELGDVIEEDGRKFLKFFDLYGNMLVAHTE
ncbi:VOC family protein [Metabacillus niabensis]|uniref:Catechol 2,3-dioxygenase-like lactoylglutathione lyase family enzyme n=1 Tax=Metabacillus niabensis TaxID=324854 RepID=A0ABT9Z635_9BACI|nr:VOC family protein [Metabacillus niabensis]MDQ0227712.1 catechol 2,3-dioxygenase-like lactoylglutathione lyase family enzyme [Metabacillus niabensis]